MQIAKFARAKLRTHKEIAKIYNVKTFAVSYLSSTLKRQSPVIVKHRQKEEQRAAQTVAINSIVTAMRDQGHSIWSIK